MSWNYKGTVFGGVNVDPNASVSIATGLPAITTFTIMNWMAKRGAGFEGFGIPQSSIFLTDGTNSFDVIQDFNFGGGTDPWSQRINGGIVTSSGVTPALNAWNHLALVLDATNFRLVIGGATVATFARAGGPTTLSALVWGTTGTGFTGNQFDGDMCCLRAYTVAMTDMQIAAEMPSATPVSTSGLVFALRGLNAATAGNDSGGNNWTASGLLTDGSSEPTFSGGGTPNNAVFFGGGF